MGVWILNLNLNFSKCQVHDMLNVNLNFSTCKARKNGLNFSTCKVRKNGRGISSSPVATLQGISYIVGLEAI